MMTRIGHDTANEVSRRALRARAASGLARLLLIICVCLLGAAGASAQYSKSSSATDKFTSAAFGPGEPGGSIDNVDSFSGRVSASLPVFTFGGRGEVGYTAFVTINRTFNIRSIQTWSAPGQYGGQWNQPFYSIMSEGFFEDLSRAEVKSGLRPGVVFARKMRNASPDPSPGAGASCETLTKLYFRTATGDIEFRDAGTNGLEQYMQSTSTFNRGKLWAARDGSAMTFFSDADIFDESCSMADYASMNGENVEFPSGYLYAKNGVRYRVVGGQITWMRDRNGNVMTFTPGDTSTVTDPAGRTYTIQTLAYAGAIQAQSVQYKGTGGVPRTISVAYAPLSSALRADASARGGVQSFSQLFPDVLWQSPGQGFNPTVLSEVTLADGRKYKFRYDELGELARIEHPNGSIVEFDYIAVGPYKNGVVYYNTPQVDRRVSERRYYDSDGVLKTRTTYERAQEMPDQFSNRVKVYEPDGTLLSYTKHYTGLMESDYNLTGFYPPYNDGKEYRTEECDANGNALVRVDYNWVPDVNSTALLADTKTAFVPTNEVKKIAYSYDQYGNTTDTYTYDFGPGNPGVLLGRAHTDYVTNPAYTGYAGAHLRALPQQAWVSTDAGGVNKLSLRAFEYDNYTPDPANGGRHAGLVARDHISGLCLSLDASFNCLTPSDSNYLTRGNSTGATRYLLANDGSVTGSATVNQQYDVAGNAVKNIGARRKADGSGYETSYDFQDRFGGPDDEARSNSGPSELAQPSGTLYTYAFATSVTDALGNTSYAQFDYYTGHVVNLEDGNNVVSNTHYDDPLDRPTKQETAVNVPPLHNQTTTVYDDANRVVTTTRDQNTLNDNRLKTETVYDGLGHTVEARVYETATQYVSTLTEYDAMGRGSKTSNPFRPALSESPIWTKTEYDILGRVSALTTPDGACLYSLYDGLKTLVMDQAGKERVTKVDALGNVTDVWEVVSPLSTDPDAEAVSFYVPAGSPVTPVSKGYRTSYTYDLKGNLRKIAQGALRRYFAYDSFGRLIRSKNPEQDSNAALALPPNMLSPLSDSTNDWSLKFDYDEEGELKTKTDARGVSTSYTYDALNRTTLIDYSDSTPDVTYGYDAAGVAYSKGRLTSVGNGVSVYGYTAYDALGRLTASAQTTDGVTYTMPDYQYDLSGNLISEQYPSGRVVKTEYDEAGRMAGVKNQSTGLYYAGAAPSDAANRIQYASHGAVSTMRLGNGLWEHASFNSRLQTKQIGLGTTGSNSTALQIDYSFGTTDNNGNVKSQTITVPGVATPYVQTYAYDDLNRLATAQETNQQIYGTTPIWKQDYTYDRNGNRALAAGTTFPAVLNAANNPTVSPSSNRVTSAGYSYDQAGNLLCDPVRQCAQSTPYYTYDAENRLATAGGGPAGGGSSYTYDGDGQRVKKVVGAVTTILVYDAAGRLVAEYSTAPPQGGGTSYVTADHLSGTRLITGQAQEIKARYDYLPFGEDLYQSRSGYGGAFRQRYTGQERDEEIGLDFYRTRYYSAATGRFTSPDSFSGKVFNPQSLNLYVYVQNNPLKWNDPTGHRRQDPTDENDPDKKHALDENNQIFEVDENGEATDKPHQIGSEEVTVDGRPPELPDSWNDMIPVWGGFRRLLFYNHTGQPERALGAFYTASVDGALMWEGVLEKGGVKLTKIVIEDAVEETGAELAVTEGAETAAHANCFEAGTLIHTTNGLVAIENLKAGDRVLSWDQVGHRLEYKQVVRTFTRVAPASVELRISGDAKPLVTTLGHPFYVRRSHDNGAPAGEPGWVSAFRLRVGDEVRRPSGAWVRVEGAALRPLPVRVYNFQVEDNHDYFVTRRGLLVHNQSPVQPYETGNFNDLHGRSVSGDGLDIHHAVQKQPAGQVIPGYNPETGPSIALPRAEHARIPNLRGAYNGTPRQLLARDVRNLRNYTNAPRSAIKKLIELNKQMYPGALGKP